jgi:hypothetical protein
MDKNQLPAVLANHQTMQPQPIAIQFGGGTPMPGASLPTMPFLDDARTRVAEAPIDKVCWESEDGIVAIRQLVKLAQKHPPSDYPCIVLQAFPRDHERVRWIKGGGVELMLTYQEVEKFIVALNEAAQTQGKGQIYAVLQSIAPKPQWRKDEWKKRNEARLAGRRGATPQWRQRDGQHDY